MQVTDLPALNAALNGTAFSLLCGAFVAIRRGREGEHRRLMLTACAVSILFLVSYLTYHFQHGSTAFRAEGLPRAIYFTILISHTILAASLVPLIVTTLRFALTGQRERHRRIARWTLPIWMYVSLTGVLIYMMLYQWFAA